MAKQNPSTNTAGEFDYDAPEGFEDIPTGFPPYWVAAEGAKFMGVVVAQDDSDEEFTRIIIQATKPVKAYRGAGKAEAVTVNPGEFFTVSVYSNLNLMPFAGLEVFVKCTGKIKADTPAGFVWGFDVKGQKGARAQMAASKQAPQLQG